MRRFFIFTAVVCYISICVSERICELQGTCFRCEHDRYSFYTCHTNNECFSDEYCNAQQFCCPINVQKSSQTHDSVHNQEDIVQKRNDISQPSKCPDNSEWVRMCKVDNDCIFRDEVCAEEKCCSSCQSKRNQFLNEHFLVTKTSNFDHPLKKTTINVSDKSNLMTSKEIKVRMRIPQCALDSRYYRPMQCENGTNDCFCVTKFGQRILSPTFINKNELSTKVFNDNSNEWKIDCNLIRENFEENQKIAQLKNHSNNEIKAVSQNQNNSILSNSFEIKKNNLLGFRNNEEINRNTKSFNESGLHTKKKKYTLINSMNLTTDDKNGTNYVPVKNQFETINFLRIRDEKIRASTLSTKNTTAFKQPENQKSKPETFMEIVSQNDKSINKQQQRSEAQLIQPECNDDPLREFKVCGSSCPISCATRNHPKCEQDICQRGCFCRLPYVIFNVLNPFGSRCVLPAECPLLSFTSDLNSWNGGFFPGLVNTQANRDRHNVYLPSAPDSFLFLDFTTTAATLMNKCSDPFKNFLTCGSACPAGCSKLSPECNNQCVSNCFCRAPYVLEDPSDMNSPCTLPHHCPTFRLETECNAKANRVWTNCASKSLCHRSCERLAASAFSYGSSSAAHLLPSCAASNECRPGCECRPPFIWLDSTSDKAECVLPIDCPPFLQKFLANNTNKTSTSTTKLLAETNAVVINSADTVNANSSLEKCNESENKEFRQCATSCPLGCDNLELRLCTPCASGCFCKNGYVFKNSLNWKNSSCVVITACSERKSQEESKKHKPTRGNRRNFIYSNQSNNSSRIITPISSQCPLKSVDINGRSCENDFECGYQQKCCSNTPETDQYNATLGKSSDVRKCTCLDPNAIWMECGTLCPDYCFGDSEASRFRFEDCPQICHPGCFCESGYIRSSKNQASPCIPITQCPIFFQHSSSLSSSIDGNERHKEESHSGVQEKKKLSTTTEKTALTIHNYNAANQKNIKENEEKKLENKKLDDHNLYSNANNSAEMCGEALTSAVLFTQNGARIGRIIVSPDRRPTQRHSFENHMIRISGEIQLSALSVYNPKENVSYYLAIHQFSDTTINGCKSVGEPLLLQVVDEDENGFVVTTSTKNILLQNTAYQQATIIDRLLLWTDVITRGTNPLIGLSIVLKTFNINEGARRDYDSAIDFVRNSYVAPFGDLNNYFNSFSNEKHLACAVLGIVPSC